MSNEELTTSAQNIGCSPTFVEFERLPVTFSNCFGSWFDYYTTILPNDHITMFNNGQHTTFALKQEVKAPQLSSIILGGTTGEN